MNEAILRALAPHGELRAAINMSNFLLVSGRSADDSPDGLSPDLAKEIATRLGVPCRLIPFEGPGQLADAVGKDIWDIGNIALEPERAQTIDFSASYIKIDANFLVRENSDITTNAEVNKQGIEIILYNRSAYDLWLKENFSYPDYVRVPSIQESHKMFYDGKADVLASLKPRLVDELAKIAGYRIIEQPFTSIHQSVGIQKGHPEALEFLNSLIADLSGNGFIERSLKRHGVEEKLSMTVF